MKPSETIARTKPYRKTGISLRSRFVYWNKLSWGPRRFIAVCAHAVKLRRLQRLSFSLWWSLVKYPCRDIVSHPSIEKELRAPKIWGVQNLLYDKFLFLQKADNTTIIRSKFALKQRTGLNQVAPTETSLSRYTPSFSERTMAFDSALNTPDWNMQWAQRCSAQTNGAGSAIQKGLRLRACSARAKLRGGLPCFAPPGAPPFALPSLRLGHCAHFRPFSPRFMSSS